ncbi:MAG: hypothetical protein EOO77_18075 [Oxalobacteraceae bacterium]|nr:MAG: hypothetical protein EOO77_18075 [Oxalobacteraceae bacterium]
MVFAAALERQQGAITAAYRIRAMVGIANSAAGVDSNLALVAAIDEQLLRLTAVAKPENLFDDATPIDDLAALDRKVAKMRADLDAPESRERYTARAESLTIDIMGAETKEFIADRIAVLKRQRVSLKDDLTATNFNTTITLADEEVAVLRAEKLID